MKLREKKLGRHGKGKKVYGMATWEAGGKKLILVDPRQNALERLDTVIHEYTHHRFPELTEQQVIEIADQLSDILWEDNWRRIER